MHHRRRYLTLTGCLAALWISPGCGDDAQDTPVTPADPHARFRQHVLGVLSRDGETRKRAFAQIRAEWPLFREHAAALASNPVLARRLAGAYMFSKLATAEDLTTLGKFLEDDSESVRAFALTGIERLGDPRMTDILVAFASSDAKYDELVRIGRYLARTAPAAAWKLCEHAAAQDSWAKRRAAVLGLAELQSEESGDLIVKLADDPVWVVKAEASRAVAKRKLVAARDRMIEFLESPDEPVLIAAIQALGSIGNDDDVDRIGPFALEAEETDVRVAGCEALAAFPAASAVSWLERVVHTKERVSDVLHAAIQGLCNRTDEPARALTQRLLEGEDYLLHELTEYYLDPNADPSAAPYVGTDKDR